MSDRRHHLLQVQKHMKLHITKELTEKDVVSRIMRKENYLIGMLNKVCAIPSAAAHPLLFEVELGSVSPVALCSAQQQSIGPCST